MTRTTAPSDAVPDVLTRPPPDTFRRMVPDDAVVVMQPASDGWPLRTISWSAPKAPLRGSLLFFGGRGDHFEKYLETFEAWRLSGWQVDSVDWRGQGGSGRLAAGSNVGHIDDYSSWVDDLADTVSAWMTRTPPPHVVIGHSMGGHLVLRGLADRRIAPDAAVLVAPMLGFTAPYPNWLGVKVARAMSMIGKSERAAWSVSEKPGSPLRLRQHLLTHDAGRYDDELWWKVERPEVGLGPASWRWVEQSYASFIHLAQPGLIEAIDTPVLVLVASVDKLVSAKSTQQVAKRLGKATIHVYGPEAAHELLREADGVRDDALRRIDTFLASAAPQA